MPRRVCIIIIIITITITIIIIITIITIIITMWLPCHSEEAPDPLRAPEDRSICKYAVIFWSQVKNSCCSSYLFVTRYKHSTTAKSLHVIIQTCILSRRPWEQSFFRSEPRQRGIGREDRNNKQNNKQDNKKEINH